MQFICPSLTVSLISFCLILIQIKYKNKMIFILLKQNILMNEL